MGAILNGLAQYGGFIPFGATFLIFSDYMRPAIRLAGLGKLHTIYVWTHDSVMLGEDGPTHQSIEQLGALRLIPNLDVLRPADAIECAAAWAHAVSRKDGPTGLVLTRQKLPPIVRPANFDPEEVLRGGYVVSRPAGPPELVMMATGSEVHVLAQAAEVLGKEGRRVQVVSMPCLELFERQTRTYQEAVIPPGNAPRLAGGRSHRTLEALGRRGGARAGDRSLRGLGARLSPRRAARPHRVLSRGPGPPALGEPPLARGSELTAGDQAGSPGRQGRRQAKRAGLGGFVVAPAALVEEKEGPGAEERHAGPDEEDVGRESEVVGPRDVAAHAGRLRHRNRAREP